MFRPTALFRSLRSMNLIEIPFCDGPLDGQVEIISRANKAHKIKIIYTDGADYYVYTLRIAPEIHYEYTETVTQTMFPFQA